MGNTSFKIAEQCFHCGDDCNQQGIKAYEKLFCCSGCKSVYEILNQNDLCSYYDLNSKPGVQQKNKVRENKFSFLENEIIQKALIRFQDKEQTHITFYIPQIHCSSCLWLLENIYKINTNIIKSTVNFPRKEVAIVFNHQKFSLKQLAELLTSLGYEPYISLNNLKEKKTSINKSKIYKLGVAGFCFGNIMLMSFPEYLGIDVKEEKLLNLFRYLNVALSLPIFFYSATEFYKSAWRSLKHGFLNIDTPIVLAIAVTFLRSLYEVFSNTGSGYFDSMSGIVFFMLIGRILQDKTYQQLNFERDYSSYFPIAVTKIKNKEHEIVSLPNIQLDDTLLIHHQELIPTDGIITKGKAIIDYSFVTGESAPIEKEMGEIVYAGGKQLGSNIEIFVIKEVSQSYLTSLWNKEELQQQKNNSNQSFVHHLGKYFTYLVLLIAISSGIYWYMHDVTKMWNAVTAVLIIACPCALLLSNTFTNGNVLRVLGKNKFYLRNAQVIEDLASINNIVFDKTGTLTTGHFNQIEYHGNNLTNKQKEQLATLVSNSLHPMSRSIYQWTKCLGNRKVNAFKEITGKGIEGIIDGDFIAIGSKDFIQITTNKNEFSTSVFLAIEEQTIGYFTFKNTYRFKIPQLLKRLKEKYSVSVLSGDNEGEKKYLKDLLGNDTALLFHQNPEDKLNYIKLQQALNKKVLMVGDGLNDAGALKQANVGIAVTDDCNNFTPASDAILESSQLPKLLLFINFCKANRKIVLASFTISLLYNIIGNYFAVQGSLSPLIAAILMPLSSISIIFFSFIAVQIASKKLN